MKVVIDIAEDILEDLRREQERQGKSLEEVVSGLVAEALAARRAAVEPRSLRWTARHLGSGIDLRDKDALWAALDLDDDSSVHPSR